MKFLLLVQNNILKIVIILLMVLLTASAFYRFIIMQDYLVAYEGDCEPSTQSCFVYCEDDECIEPFYYSIIERRAYEVYEKCGADVTLCDDAYICPDNVAECEIIYCDPNSEQCDEI